LPGPGRRARARRGDVAERPRGGDYGNGGGGTHHRRTGWYEAQDRRLATRGAQQRSAAEEARARDGSRVPVPFDGRADEERDIRATNGRGHTNAHLGANLCPHQGRANDGKDEKDERKAVPVVRRAGEPRIEVRQTAKLRRDQYGCRRRPRRDQRRGDQLKSPRVDGNRGDEPDCQRDPRTTAVREIDGRCEDDERG